MKSIILGIGLVLVIAMSLGCDENNNVIAQEPEPDLMDPGPMEPAIGDPEPGTCPCFGIEDIPPVEFSCSFTTWRVSLTPTSGDTSKKFSAACNSTGTICNCVGTGSDFKVMDVSVAEASGCMYTLVQFLPELGQEDLILDEFCSLD